MDVGDHADGGERRMGGYGLGELVLQRGLHPQVERQRGCPAYFRRVAHRLVQCAFGAGQAVAAESEKPIRWEAEAPRG